MIVKFLYKFGHSIIFMIPRARSIDKDVESGEREIRGTTEVPEEFSYEQTAEKARIEFRRSLQRVFSNVEQVNEIMRYIEDWEDKL